jgi:ABC-type transporter Mla MlaB component
MTKRKKATNAPSRPTRGTHAPDSSGPANAARADALAQIVENPTAPTAAALATANPSPTELALTAECLVAGASALKESLASLLDEPQPITLDITALQRIDTAGLQVLTAFIRERASHGRTVEWRGAAPALSGAAQLLGLTSLLRLPA